MVQTPHTVSAVVERHGALLLVQERLPHDMAPTWMLPGGQVNPGESLENALRREVREETGLEIIGAPRLAFSVDVEAVMEDMVGAWRATTFACDADGDLFPADPDGLIVSANWVPLDEALTRLEQVEWYDSGPLRAFLSADAPPGRPYRYAISGKRGAVVRSAVEVIDIIGPG